MYPGFISWHRRRHCGESRVETGCAPESWTRARRWDYAAAGEEEGAQFGGGAFGVRRPLRFLAYKLELDDHQVAELARILDELKTERAQAAVDQRRALSAFAEAVSGETFDGAKANAGAQVRMASAERLRTAVIKALGELHGLLTEPQRARLAYLIRTGTLAL